MSNLNGVNSIIIEKNSNGEVNISLQGMIGDIKRIADDAEFGNFIDLEVISFKEQGASASVTLFSRQFRKTELKTQNPFHFKSLPKGFHETYKDLLIPKPFLPSLQEPSTDIKIKVTDDIYGADEKAWTAKEILTEIAPKGTVFNIPSSLDYKVFDLFIPQATPIVSIIQSLFPFPGISISVYENEYNVCLPLEDDITFFIELLLSLQIEFCEQINTSSKTYSFEYDIEGSPGEPLNITSEREKIIAVENTGSDIQGSSQELIINQVGGVFGIKEESYTQTESSEFIEDMYSWE